MGHLLKNESAFYFYIFTSLLSFMYDIALSNSSLLLQVDIPSKDLHSSILLIDSSVGSFGLLALIMAKKKRLKCLLNISINNNLKKITFSILILCYLLLTSFSLSYFYIDCYRNKGRNGGNLLKY